MCYLCVFLCVSPIVALPSFGAWVIIALLNGEGDITPLLCAWAVISAACVVVGVLAELGAFFTRLSGIEGTQATDGCEEGYYVRMWQMFATAVLEFLFLRGRLTASVPSSHASNSNVV